MNKIRIAGILCLIIGIIGLTGFSNSGYDFLFGIITGLGTGWLITGKFIVFSRKEKELIRSSK